MCEPAEQRLVNKAPDPLFNNITHGTPNNVGSIYCYGESEGYQLLLTSETTFVPGSLLAKWGEPGTRNLHMLKEPTALANVAGWT